MHKVIINISAAKPVISVKGVKGKSCKDITKELEKALGKSGKSTPTPEYYQSSTHANEAIH